MSPPFSSTATMAEFLRRGIELDLWDVDLARAWADEQIRHHDEPPHEIIEIAWSKGVGELLTALSAVQGERNKPLAGAWLLGLIANQIADDAHSLAVSARQAMNVARLCELDESVYDEFDGIEDSIYLARDQQHGTLQDCKQDLLQLLSKHALPLPPSLPPR
ncbi:hypothetical protein ABXN37_27745 [Piscinibacter sakaiensis]